MQNRVLRGGRSDWLGFLVDATRGITEPLATGSLLIMTLHLCPKRMQARIRDLRH
jgi:hypothetical protein